jgi:heme-degrading monooxygenase HmoA
MFARSTTVRGTSKAIDDGIVYVRTQVMPAVQRTDGCIGLSMLAERETGRSIVTTSWADRQSMANSAADATAMQQRAAEIMGGPAEVQEWEIALMYRLHSAHHGACDRVIWHDGDPADVERVIDIFRMNVLPQLEELPGCCSVSVLLDRGSGRSTVAVTYDSPQDMRAARERAVQMRTEFMEKMNRTITEVAEFELVISELRVPETA